MDGERDRSPMANDGAPAAPAAGVPVAVGPTAGVRLVAVTALAVLVVLSGTLLSRAGTAAGPGAAPGAGVASGAWFCPHGGGPGWTGWLAVANPGRSPVRVRTTTFAGAGSPTVRNFTLGASNEVFREIPVGDPAASTEVEYFGGWVAAGTVVRSHGPGADVAAERCVEGLSREWILPDETATADENASVIVMNPYAAPAEFNIVIRTNNRTVRPGALTPIVLGPGASTSVSVNRWVIEGPTDDTETVEVDPVIGRVIAGSMVVSPRGIRAEAGLSTATRWVLPAAGYGSSARLEVVNPSRVTASMTVVAQGPKGANTIPVATGVAVRASSARTFDVGVLADAGITVDSGKAPVAVALRLGGPNGGEALLGGWPQAASRWIVPPTLPPTGGAARLVLQNPGSTDVSVELTWLGPGGPVASRPATVDVPAGRTVSVAVPSAGGPLFALVTALKGSIIAAEMSQSIASTAFAATSGVPLG